MNNDFFNEAFDGYNLPDNIRRISEEICTKFDIKGICDPMYIANVIGVALGIGDGRGNFSDNEPMLDNIEYLAKRLKNSYGCNIDDLDAVIFIVNANVTR